MRHFFIIPTLLFIWIIPIKANTVLDSLISIEIFENDSIEATTYFNIADTYFKSKRDLKKFEFYTEKGIKTANKMANQFLIAEGYRFKGRLFGYQKEIDSAIVYLDKASTIFTALNDSLKLALVYNNISGAYQRSYMTQKSINYTLKTINIYEDLEREDLIVVPLYNLALTFSRQGDYNKSLNYLKKVYQISNEIEIKPLYKASIANQLARTYGNIYENEGDTAYLDSVIKYANIGLIYSQQKKLKHNELDALGILYGYYYFQEDYRKSLSIVNIMLTKSIGFDDKNLSNAYRKKSDLLLILNQPKEAAILADSALTVAIRMDRKSHLMYAHKIVYESNKALGNYKKAIYSFEQYTKLENEIINLEKTEIINDLEKKYQTEKKEHKINALEQQNLVDEQDKELQNIKIKNQYWIILCLIVFAIVIVILVWSIAKQQKLKKDRKIIETKHKLLRSQMNPHFLFNGFTAIQHSIMKDENKINAVTHLSEFSRLMRSVLESSFNEFVSFENELDLIENYLKIQRFRFGNTVTYQIKVDPEINKSSTQIPPMLLQPFLENSIEHGRGLNEHPVNINLHFRINNSNLIIEIEDNGVGINNENNEQTNHVSRAQSIVEERLFLLEPLLHKKSTVKIVNLVDFDKTKTGVKVLLTLPLKKG